MSLKPKVGFIVGKNVLHPSRLAEVTTQRSLQKRDRTYGTGRAGIFGAIGTSVGLEVTGTNNVLSMTRRARALFGESQP